MTRPLREVVREAAHAAARAAIVEALDAHGWNLTRAARALGLSRCSSLVRAMERHGMADVLDAARADGRITHDWRRAA